jgi:hypothetical protein
MKPIRTLVAALALAGGSAFAGTAEVRFVGMENFADFSSDPIEQSEAIKAIQGHLQYLARRLPPDAVLHVDVLDVDLAGARRPNRRGTEVRVLRGQADWPKISLRWALEANGQGMGGGEDKLADLGYLDRDAANPGTASGFYYEKRLLDRWFNENFGGRGQGYRR